MPLVLPITITSERNMCHKTLKPVSSIVLHIRDVNARLSPKPDDTKAALPPSFFPMAFSPKSKR